MPHGDAPTTILARCEMGPSIGMYHVPRLPVLHGVIESMFLTYESIVQWNRHALFLWNLPAVAEIYFHKSQVSFSSDRHRQNWSKCAAGMQDPPHSHQDQGRQEEQRPGGATDFGQMKSADSYTSFLTKASQSQATTWTALFLTFDESWHYWGAVLMYSAVKGRVDIYIRPLEELVASAEESQPLQVHLSASQKRLGAACRAQRWSAKMHMQWEQRADIDMAFGWMKIWGADPEKWT
jgi:hypothetical protein